MSIEYRISELKIELPQAPKAAGLYRPVVLLGNTAYLSGHLPANPDGSLITGKLGSDLDTAAGKAAARAAGLAILSSLRAHLGNLDRVHRLVKLLGLVNSTPDFRDHPAVINGCSELFVEVLGEENGIGARSALGVASLPAGVAVEVEAIFEIH